MPKRPFLAVLVCGTALVLVLNFKTPSLPPVAPAGSMRIVEGEGCCGPMPSADSSASVASLSGTFTGSAVQTRFGPVQVRVTLEDGRITRVEAIQVPDGDPRSSQISDSAIPVLVEGTLQAQSSQVDSISGATYTCQAFMQSLESALEQAGV